MEFPQPTNPNPNPGQSSRLPISHPYPPTYRASISQQQQQQHQYHYQRRDRNPSQDTRPTMPSAYGPGYSEESLAPAYNAPYEPTGPYNLAPSPNPEPREDEPFASSAASLPSRMRSARWTKEDEEAEREFLRKGLVDWHAVKSWRFWIRKEWWFYYLILALISVLVILMSVFHDQIVGWLTPVANWMKNLPAGWTIPIAVLFVISFPPLFGHEIVAILVGVVWGLWVGFGIVSAGTFLGEIGNFYAFKYCLRSMAEKHERTNFNYACLAHVVREGGFMIIFMARLSAIPGHFTTAVFSTVGVNIWLFVIATILTLPKQLTVVYLGVIFKQGEKTTKDKIISDSVLAIGFLITILAAWYIWREMSKARVIVWRRQRMALAGKGVSMDPVTGKQRSSYKDPETGEVDDSRSPILQQHRIAHQSYQSYRNPYDIQYRPNDTMSVYDVDGPHPLPEQDIGYSHDPRQSELFPEARPSGVRRSKTNATTYTVEIPSEPAQFPIPSPARISRDMRSPNGTNFPVTYGRERYPPGQ
ncbi:hypothetical protein TREMEDRAFT_74454 [Tremella mesenterica DSM 1558]|uniref:uncharacterized protein n=1 Tax=Tremella mesenterica (strain ATCC 24925 / CBS 8224 / DSM 1558 / NBRC 9311 / NRRL Y-6157 / RJB 2259-6 / UBC 559-6) TaxID=578456 RepID=UPI0003F499C7|nr:uncharacterized protein TREMEDRAFT_74454 [Tremella mesenterica DSM 1558]EIW67590.1 hypothetical protein TREMEDRAFT_74454 [Tremella mesenterica DSM 1558]